MLQHNVFNQNEPGGSSHHKNDSRQFHTEKLQDGVDDFEAKRKLLIDESLKQDQKINAPEREGDGKEGTVQDGTFMF